MFSISEITEKDLFTLKQYLDELIDDDADVERMKIVLKEVNSRTDYKIFGIYDTNLLAGSASAAVCLDISGTCQPFLVLENFVVGKKYQRKGLGSMLLEHVENFGKQQNCKYIIFVSSMQRTISHKFYESNGYQLDKVQGFKKYL